MIRAFRNLIAWCMCVVGCGMIMGGAFRQDLGISLVGLVIAGLGYGIAD